MAKQITQREFKKIKLIKDLKAEVIYTTKNADGKTSRIDETSDGVPHPDFVGAMKRLQVHFGLLTGYIKTADVKKPDSYGNEILDSFKVRGITIGGDDEDQGVVISGHRILPGNGKAIILNTPFTRFNEEEGTGYKFMTQLLEEIENIKDEATKYLGGKFAKDPQGSLPFEKQNITDEATR